MTALFPITAFLLANTAYFWLDGLPMRIVFVLVSSSMLINALLSGSISAVIGETVAIGLHLKAIHALNRHTPMPSTDQMTFHCFTPKKCRSDPLYSTKTG
jgi:hypothetical protein